MPLLAPLTPVSPPAVEIPLAAKVKGQTFQVKAAPRRMAEDLIRKWETAFDFMWTERDGVTPAMRLADLGPLASELFDENAALVEYLISRLTGKDDATVARIMAKVATIPPYTIHEDGTVTLD